MSDGLLEQIVAATTVSDARISPDGQQVLYVTAEASMAGEHAASVIWIVPAAGGNARQLTTSGASDRNPRWSPDGTAIAFLSDRERRGVSQLYLLDLTGGEARRLTDHGGGVAEHVWSPDGTAIAYTAYAGETEAAKRRRLDRDDARVLSEASRRAGLFTVAVSGTAPDTDTTPRRLSPEGLHIGSYLWNGVTWLPDGSGLVAVAGPGSKADDLTRPEIVVIDLQGSLRSLGVFEGLTYGPTPSPDGTTLAFIAAEGAIPARFSLQTVPLQGGEPQVVVPGISASFFGVNWLPDGERLLASVDQGQSSRLLLIDLERRTVVDTMDAPAHDGTVEWEADGGNLSANGARVAFVAADASALPDVYVADVGRQATRLTDLNPWVRDHEFGELREISWTSFDGLTIEGLLILPVGYRAGTRYPLLTHIHGGPAWAWKHALYASWHDWGHLLSQRGYATFMPNPRGSTGRDIAFLTAITGCYGEPDWQDIMTGIDALIEQGIADPDQLVVGGWSGGGFLTNWAITHTDRFKAAISGAGISNWVSSHGTADLRTVFTRYTSIIDEEPEGSWRLSPIRYIREAANTPTLFLHGELDDRVPISQAYEMYEGLKQRGIETEMVVYPREGHGIMERRHQIDLLRRVVDWYDRHLGRQ